jgi:hypothetical protein
VVGYKPLDRLGQAGRVDHLAVAHEPLGKVRARRLSDGSAGGHDCGQEAVVDVEAHAVVV